MITAVDTNILIDVLIADPQHGQASASALQTAISKGRVVACGPVWAELATVFTDPARCLHVMDEMSVRFGPDGP